MTRTYPTVGPLLVAALLVAALVAGAAVPVGASHEADDQTDLGDTFDSEEEASTLDSLAAAAQGVGARAAYRVSTAVGDDPTAEESASEAVEAFNTHNDTFVEYANARNISEGEVAAVEFRQNGETETVYIVANRSNGSYQSAEAVAETNRTVDHEITLEGIAAAKADEEIEIFAEQYAEPGKDPGKDYLARMASTYGGHVDEPFTGE